MKDQVFLKFKFCIWCIGGPGSTAQKTTCGFGHIYCRNPNENFIFVQWWWEPMALVNDENKAYHHCLKKVRMGSFYGPNAKRYGPENFWIRTLFTQCTLFSINQFTQLLYHYNLNIFIAYNIYLSKLFNRSC